MKTSFLPAALCVASFSAATTASAQTVTQIPLNYNFNGIVHAGEDLMPDAPDGYRSIADRGLNFSGGVPSDALTAPYSFVSSDSWLIAGPLTSGSQCHVDLSWTRKPTAASMAVRP